MYSSRFLKIAVFIITPLLLILLFEWVNVESQYEDQSMVETSIQVSPELTIKQKATGLKETYKIEKGMQNVITIIKCLLITFTIILIFILYQINKPAKEIS